MISRRLPFYILWLMCLLLGVGAWAQAALVAERKLDPREAYGKLPLYFIANQGQFGEAVRYFEKGRGHDTFFTPQGVYLRLARPDGGQALLKLGFTGANTTPEIEALDLQPGKINYFIGSDPGQWKTDIPTYGALMYRDLYPGIDVRFYGNNRQLEYDVIVAPGADPGRVRLHYTGIQHLGLNEQGELVIDVGNGKLYQSRPFIYQEVDGRRIEIPGRFRIDDPRAFAFSFELGDYDRSLPLVIDPIIDYSTYLGGSGTDTAYGIAVDGSGNAYVTGETNSTEIDFPLAAALYNTNSGARDAFVTKFDPTGALVYSTFFGGANDDSARAIAVDSSGNVYIAGSTASDSVSFPLSATPYQAALGGVGGGGVGDAFIARINAAGNNLDYSSYLGGTGDEIAYAIAADDAGVAYIAGKTDSADFPVVSAYQGTISGIVDAFVARVDTTLSGTASLVYSTYLGGTGDEAAYGIAIDALGNAYVTGETTSIDFPLSATPLNNANAGGMDAFVTELNATGNGVVFSTYLGGTGTDRGHGIAVDGSGVYVAGETSSTDFPVATPIHGSNAGLADAFVTKLDSAGAAYVYSTYLGGSGTDIAYALTVDGAGNAYIAGQTDSTDLPTVVPLFATLAGGIDAFIGKINTAGSAVDFSTYLGGDGGDIAYGLAVDGQENAFVAGQTGPITVTAFPTVNPYDNTLAGTDAFVTRMTTTSADLSITKAVDDGAPIEGATIVYTLTVTNSGPSDASGVSVNDTLPAGVTYVSDDGAGAYAAGVWTVGALANGASATLNITAAVDAGTAGSTITNTATVSAAETDPNSANDSASVDITVSASADLAMAKSVDNATPLEGDTIVYTLTVTNNGPNDATGVSVNDTLPAGVTYVSDDGAGAYAGGVWSIGNLLNGATATLNITATVDTGTVGTTIDNTATVSGAETDPAAANDSATASVSVGATADLAMAKVVDNASPNEGDSIVYTLTVTNNGPNTATTVSVADSLPAGVTYVSDDGGGAYNSGTGTWTIGTLANGAGATLNITATVDAGTAGTTITNTATASTADTDPAPANDTASAALTVLAADLALTKTVDNSGPLEGENIIYTITVTNNGPDPANNVIVNDQLPAGVSYVSDTTTVGAYNGVTGDWIVGTLANGASATLNITATVDAGTSGTTITNTATSNATEGDPVPANDNASVGITVGAVTADLAMAKVVDNASPNEGDSIVYTLTVTNNGPNTATTVSVADSLPAGVTYVSDDGGGAYNSGTGTWTIGTLANGAGATLNITATVDAGTAGTTITNTATASTADTDPAPANDTASAALTVLAADLALTKTVDNTAPIEGGTIVYTVSITNNGPNDATNVMVTDQLPTGVSYVSDVPSAGAYNSASGQWIIGTLPNAATETLTITATVDSGTTGMLITNTATASATEGDPNALNDVGTVDITVGVAADLGIVKTVDNNSPAENGVIIYTITVDNSGPNDATGVVVTDLLPAGVSYVSDDSGGAYDSVTGAWTVGNLLNAASATLNITASVNPATAGTTITNTATAAATESDPNSLNDSGSVAIVVNTPPVANPDVASITEDALPDTVSGDMRANDSDLEDLLTSLTVIDVGGDTTGTVTGLYGTLSWASDGTFTYQIDNANPTVQALAVGQTLNDVFSYIIGDTDGDTATSTLTVTISGANDPPVAVDDAATTDENLAVTTGDVLLNDTDIDGDVLSVASADTLSANGGTVVNNGNGTFTYTPATAFSGTDTFTYTVSDGNGGTAVGTVTITVIAADNPPVADPQSVTTAEEAPLAITLTGSDPEGLPVTYSIATQPLNGVLTGTAPNVTYTPNLDFNGTDSFTFTVNDGVFDSAPGTVTITVTPVNDAPVAVDDTATVPEDGTVTTGNVLLNDTDVEGDPLTVAGVTNSVFGATVIDNGDGTFTFTPRPDFFGTDWFDYIVSDGNGGSDQGTVAITVTPSNDPPTAVADGAVTDRDVPVTTGNVLNNDIDVDGDTLTITGADTTSANGGTVVNNGDGTFTYTPPPLFNGTDTFTYTVSDGNGASSQGVVSIVVNIADSFTQVGTNVQVTPGLGVRMTFDNVTASGSSTASVISTVPAPPPGFSFGTQTQFLNISTTATFTGNVEVCVPYDETQFSSERSLVLLHWNTTAIGWESLASTLDADTNTVCGITTSLSPFAVAQESSTAVTLREFTAIHRADRVDLSWVTSSETNNEGFILLRGESPDGPFAPLTPDMIPARGGPGLTMTYTFTDFNVQPERDYYYRLQDIDSRGMKTSYDVLAKAPGGAVGGETQVAATGAKGGRPGAAWRGAPAGKAAAFRPVTGGNVLLAAPVPERDDEMSNADGAAGGQAALDSGQANAASGAAPSRQAAAVGKSRFRVRHQGAPATLYDGMAAGAPRGGHHYARPRPVDERPSNAFSVSIVDARGNVIQVDRLGDREGGSLKLTSLRTAEEDGRQVVTWQVSDLRARGFALYRSERGQDRYVPVVNFVPNYGQDDGGRYMYRFSDNTAQAGKAYDYRLEVREWGASANAQPRQPPSAASRQEPGRLDSGHSDIAA